MKTKLKKIIIVCSLIFFYMSVFGQNYSKKELRYKPKNLDEAIIELSKFHDDSTKKIILTISEDDFTARNHFGLGMTLRNDWGLWTDSELKGYFISIGIYHPDDMSGIILRSYYRFLSGADRELDKQIEKCQHFYKITAIPHRDTYPEGVKRLTFGSWLHYKSEENGSGCIIVQLNVKDDHPWIYDYYFG